MLLWPAGLLPTQADMPHPHTLLRAARGCFVLCFHDECHPLSRPLPLHLATLAQEYVLPFAPAPAPAARAALRVARELGITTLTTCRTGCRGVSGPALGG